MDDLSKFMLYALLALCIISIFVRSSILNVILLLGLLLIYFRMLSKNHTKRYQENVKFLQIKDKVLHSFRREKNIAIQKKDFRIYTCPSCKQKTEFPRERGKYALPAPNARRNLSKEARGNHVWIYHR